MLLLILIVLTNTMCPPDTVKCGYDALGRNIGLQEYLDKELDTCDYRDLENPITVSKHDFVILQHNIRGVTSKKEKLKSLIDSCLIDKTPDMLLLCETWLNPFSPDITIPGYELYWTDR